MPDCNGCGAKDVVSRHVHEAALDRMERVNRGMDAEKAWLVMDELMETLLAINPRLYNGVIRQLNT